MNDYLVWGEGFAAYAIANAVRHTDSISWPFAILLGCATSNFVRVNLQKIVRSFPRDSVFDGIARTLAFFDQVAPVAPLANAGEAPVVVNPVVVSNADEKMVKSFKSSENEIMGYGHAMVLGRRRKLQYSFIDDNGGTLPQFDQWDTDAHSLMNGTISLVDAKNVLLKGIIPRNTREC